MAESLRFAVGPFPPPPPPPCALLVPVIVDGSGWGLPVTACPS